MSVPPLERSLSDRPRISMPSCYARVERRGNVPFLDRADFARPAHLALQSRAVPAAAVGRSGISCRKEVKDQCLWIASRVHDIVGQNEFSHGFIEVSAFCDLLLAISGRFWIGVRVERGAWKGLVSRPETSAADFVRISLAGHGIR